MSSTNAMLQNQYYTFQYLNVEKQIIKIFKTFRSLLSLWIKTLSRKAKQKSQMKKFMALPWPGGSAGGNDILYTKRLQVLFPVRVHT